MRLKGISIFSRFSKNITRFVLAELDLAIDARKSGDTTTEFKHLENAHLPGQESTYWHYFYNRAIIVPLRLLIAPQ